MSVRKRTTPEFDELRDLIRARKLRATPARVAVLHLLRTTDVPLTHDEVLRELGTQACDRSTIYRALNRLSTARLVRRSDLGDHVWRFSAITAADTLHAYRIVFVCSKCGSVLDLAGLELASSRVNLPRAIARGQIEVHVIGPCNDCL